MAEQSFTKSISCRHAASMIQGLSKYRPGYSPRFSTAAQSLLAPANLSELQAGVDGPQIEDRLADDGRADDDTEHGIHVRDVKIRLKRKMKGAPQRTCPGGRPPSAETSNR